jgi:hypothetical protein
MRVMNCPIPVKFVVLLLFCPLLLAACGGRAMNKKVARDLMVASPLGPFDKEDVYIKSVIQTGQRDAIAEGSLKAAFRFEKVGGRWLIREVRFGSGPWEKFEDVLQALQAAKVAETRRMLEAVGAAAEQYQVKYKALPDFKDYVTLTDTLYPEYLTHLFRLDAWQRPLQAYREGASTMKLVSAGPDGKLGTGDDISLRRAFPP